MAFIVFGLTIKSLSCTSVVVTVERQCPGHSTGQYPICVCQAPFTGTPPNCQGPEYLPVAIEPCPPGYYGRQPNCYQPCPPYHIGKRPNCERMKCPSGWTGTYQPDCQRVQCPANEVGLYPNCRKITSQRTYVDCPPGLTGNPPNDCYVPCPPSTYGRPPNCSPVKCPKGWTGSYQPNCSLKPSCPSARPGVWPDCRPQYCPSGTVGQFPNCRCAPGSVGQPPNCTVLIEIDFLPPLLESAAANNGTPAPSSSLSSEAPPTSSVLQVLGYLPPLLVPSKEMNGYLPPPRPFTTEEPDDSDNNGYLPPLPAQKKYKSNHPNLIWIFIPINLILFIYLLKYTCLNVCNFYLIQNICEASIIIRLIFIYY